MVDGLTLTRADTQTELRENVGRLVRENIPGAFVECGVYRGGSMVIIARTLLELGAGDRDLLLYDTFAGMPLSGPEDGRDAQALFVGGELACSQEEVLNNLAATGYDVWRVHLIEGRVEDTLPFHLPAGIALLRLDTDWYASTRAELEYLYPSLYPGGCLIVDDYGAWPGCKQAVDEYFGRAFNVPDDSVLVFWK